MPLLLVLLLIGFPAIFGAYILTAEFGKRDVSKGASILLYAAGLSLAFAILLPEGKMLEGTF